MLAVTSEHRVRQILEQELQWRTDSFEKRLHALEERVLRLHQDSPRSRVAFEVDDEASVLSGAEDEQMLLGDFKIAARDGFDEDLPGELPKKSLAFENTLKELLPLSSARGRLATRPTHLGAPHMPSLLEVIPMDSDVFGMTAVLLVDEGHVHWSSKGWGVRFTRCVLTLSLYFLVIFLQVMFLLLVKWYVTAESTENIRSVYDEFERVMYGNDTSHMYLTVNGKHRGILEYYNSSYFSRMSERHRLETCNIPFSQPLLFFTTLFIWTVSCMAEVKAVVTRFMCLVVRTETLGWEDLSTSSWQLPAGQAGNNCDVYIGKYSSNTHTRVIHRLSLRIKILLCVLLFIPRLIITSVLLWLGSRWLASTDSFEGVVLNVAALDFVLRLKELIYNALAPTRGIIDVSHTFMLPVTETIPRTYAQMGSTMAYLTLSAFWVFAYVFSIQAVLPDYRWDVHKPCSEFLHRTLGT